MCRLVSGSASSPRPPLAPLQAPRSTAASGGAAPPSSAPLRAPPRRPPRPPPGPAQPRGGRCPRRNTLRGRCAGRQRPRRHPLPAAVGETTSPRHELFIAAGKAALPGALLTCCLLPKGGGWHRARPCPAGGGEPRGAPPGARGCAGLRPSPPRSRRALDIASDRLLPPLPPPQQTGGAAQLNFKSAGCKKIIETYI